MAKRRKAFYPKDDDMKLVFEDILKSENYIVITRRDGEAEGESGIISTIRFEADPVTILKELEYYAELIRPRAEHYQQMNQLLNDNNIDEI